jgi:hypothetical protein
MNFPLLDIETGGDDAVELLVFVVILLIVVLIVLKIIDRI